MRRPPEIALLLSLGACHAAVAPCVSPSPSAQTTPAGNIVLIVLDDVGVDKIGAYGVHDRPAPTPRIDALAAQGMRFVSAYAEPTCSPSRAALLTGRRPVRTGIGQTIGAQDGGYDLPDEEVLIPEALKEAPSGPWATFAVGKWHLSVLDEEALTAPLRQGFDRYDGILANPTTAIDRDPLKRGYFRWEHDLDGQLSISEDYLLEAQTEAALGALASLPEPFFLYVAFSGAHGPIHTPPEHLWSLSSPHSSAGEGDAMIEALDHEVGRLVDAIGDRATVLLMGDNGTSRRMVREPSSHRRAKSTVYTGGTHVPLIAAGPGIAPGVSEALVHVTDLFPTVLGLAGLDATALGLELDGTSLLPLLEGGDAQRRCVVVERFEQNGRSSYRYDVSLLEPEYTLVREHGRPDELYARDPLAAVEGPDLLEGGALEPAARAALQRMRRMLREDRR